MKQRLARVDKTTWKRRRLSRSSVLIHVVMRSFSAALVFSLPTLHHNQIFLPYYLRSSQRKYGGHYSVTDLRSFIGKAPGATVSISVTHVHIGPSSDSASVPTSGSRSPRSGGLSHGNLKCFNKIQWCWFTSVISWLCNFHFQPDTQQ